MWLNRWRCGGFEFFAGERVAIEHGDEIHGSLHAAAVVFDQQQVGRVVGGNLRSFAQELLEQFHDFGGVRVFQENQVEDHALVVGERLGVGVDGGVEGKL